MIRALVVMAAVVVACCAGLGSTTSQLPAGLFVPSVHARTATGEISVCVAVELGSDAAVTGQAIVHWWTNQTEQCDSRASGITAQPAAIQAVTLAAAGGLPERTGYRVSFEVGRIPTGTDEVVFTLDPEFARRNGFVLAALVEGDSTPSVTFSKVETLDIPGPGDDGPVATPVLASP